MERLQKIIAHSGYTSRRKAEDLIVAGKVKVNGVIVKELGTKVKRSDDIIVEGNILSIETKVYYVLYKPEGYISSTDDEKGRKTVLDLVPRDKRIYPVGRLDYDTSGILLLTNDGDFTNLMTSPKHHIQKEYRVKLKGFLRKEESTQVCRGIRIDNYKTRKAIIKDVVYNKESETTLATIIITEGKYHQVKLMFEAVGHTVLRLKRVRFGIINLDNMRIGEHRLLKPYEIKQLKGLVE
jgi:23S rRNA pseudouridine2605 synthase